MPENAAMTGSSAHPTRPLIGITTYREQARFGAWNSSADLLHAPESATGVVTSGGTESIFLALKTARDWARVEKPHIVAPASRSRWSPAIRRT